jgi:hypothetical protein
VSTTDALDLDDLDVCEVCGLDEACADCLAADLADLDAPDAEPRRLTRQEREAKEALDAALRRTPEEWSAIWVERYDPTAAWIEGVGHSCVRCGRQDAGFGTNDHHYCGPPYFRPRGRLHPLGPTAAAARAEEHARTNPTLF